MKRIACTDKNDVYHVSCNGEPLSRAQIASRILSIHHKLGLAVKIEKLKEENCTNPDFPRRLVLDTEKTKSELGIEFCSIDDALYQHVLRTRRK